MSACKAASALVGIAVGVAACGPAVVQAKSKQVTALASGVAAGGRQTAQARLNSINEADLVAPLRPLASNARPRSRGAAPGPDPIVIKAEVLLGRAHASPGVIDGLAGSNLGRAISAYEQMNGLPADGQLRPALWSRLTGDAQAKRPVAITYTETAADVAGPFYPDVGDDFVAASKLPTLGYSGPAEELAARFHMSEALLKALNPGADFSRAGTTLLVVQPAVDALPPIDHLQVDKNAASVRAYDSQDDLVGSFPATVGSVEKPSPDGVRKVIGVSHNPTYTYDPSKLSWGPKSHGKFTIKPGPNNPVGLVWIALNAPGYGIHGSPNPDKIGKTASHGCVRLTNWDALLLASAVKQGVEVAFVDRGSS